MDSLKLTRDDLVNLQEVLIEQIELPTKTKTAFTREYNKTHLKNTGKNIKKLTATTDDELEDEILEQRLIEDAVIFTCHLF